MWYKDLCQNKQWVVGIISCDASHKEICLCVCVCVCLRARDLDGISLNFFMRIYFWSRARTDVLRFSSAFCTSRLVFKKIIITVG
jgi:hypothetical protein